MIKRIGREGKVALYAEPVCNFLPVDEQVRAGTTFLDEISISILVSDFSKKVVFGKLMQGQMLD